MPGNKPAPTKPAPPPKPRQQRARGFGRPRRTPTETVRHAVATCPDCGTRLAGGWGQWTREVLGATFAGVLVSDCSAGYHHDAGVHQRWWAHLLRAIHARKEGDPTDPSLADWAAVVLKLYQEAVSFASPDARQRLANHRELDDRLRDTCRPFLKDRLAVQAKLCRRIERHISELFVFVGNPAVPPTNNAAERRLRHLVTSRTIRGGTQPPAGTTSKLARASLFGTWRAQGLNPLHECRRLLQSPHQ